MSNGASLGQVGHSSRTSTDKALAFFMRFVRAPKQVGSVIPSSCYLERRLIRRGEVARARTVVELGPGTGGTTQAILNALPQDGKLLAIEIDPRLADIVRADIADPRLITHQGSAEHLALTLAEHGLPAPDVVISGIPFSTMPRELGEKILHGVRQTLAPGGRFVAYQLRDRVAVLGRGILGAAETDVEFLNVPPVRVYRWRKPG
jgi:phosphatidylethanolamine/phosphatidyl-N-methylethanolamine N-methyltransferase